MKIKRISVLLIVLGFVFPSSSLMADDIEVREPVYNNWGVRLGVGDDPDQAIAGIRAAAHGRS